MQEKMYWLDYDPVALAVLVIGPVAACGKGAAAGDAV